MRDNHPVTHRTYELTDGMTLMSTTDTQSHITDVHAAFVEVSGYPGVAPVGEAVSQMDQATRQNAALVEESAAAAESLKTQAQPRVQVLAAFRVDGGGARSDPAPAPQAATQPVDRRSPGSAQNVARPAFGKKTAASAPARAHPEPKTGTDGWTTS